MGAEVVLLGLALVQEVPISAFPVNGFGHGRIQWRSARLILDKSLPGRAIRPNATLHQISAKKGFDYPDICANATQLLQVAEVSLKDDSDIQLLTPLKDILAKRRTKSHELIAAYQSVGSIEQALQNTYAHPSIGSRTNEQPHL